MFNSSIHQMGSAVRLSFSNKATQFAKVRHSTRLLHHTPTCYVSESNNGKGKIWKSKDSIETVKDITIPEFLWSNLHKWSKAPAIECGVTGRKYTHEQLYKLSRNFGAALLQHGLKRPDVVGILLPNIPEFPIAVLGSLEANLIVTTLNPIYTTAEIAKQLNDSKAKAIVTQSQSVPLIREVQKLVPSLKSIITIGEEPVEGCHSLYEMMKADSTGVEFAKGSQFDTTEEIAFLPYSSGTTGPPKGVMLTHSSICTNIYQFTRPGYVAAKFFEDGNPQERFIAILPLFHSFGFSVVMCGGIYQGAFTRTLPKFDPATFTQAVREHKPTSFHLVPPLIAFMAASPEFTKKEFASLNAINGGAAPIGEALISRVLQKAEKDFLFQEGYGMTELSPVSHLIPDYSKNDKIGSCGVLLPSTLCTLRDSDGNCVGPNQRGEICIKGPQVMKGYFNNENATAETIDSDGWLRTGDIGVYDDDEYLTIVDRIKELIKVKGLQVAPSELEDILRTHPDVADVGVIGIPDERAGELPRAYIVKKRDSLKEIDVANFVAEKVAEHKKLKGGVEFVTQIPKAVSGKILRRELKSAYLAKK